MDKGSFESINALFNMWSIWSLAMKGYSLVNIVKRFSIYI